MAALSTTGNGGGVSTQNLQFARSLDNYLMMRHTLEGQRRIKEEATTYLMKPPALVDPGNDPKGLKYAFYRSFAEFPEIVSLALMGIQGLVHSQPATVELPSQLKYLIENATPDGKSLQELWSDMTREVFLMGRSGLLPEVYSNNVFLCQYEAENIINWRKIKSGSGMTASLVVLHEPTEEPTGEGFGSEVVNYYRVLRMESGAYIEELYKEQNKVASTGAPVDGMAMLPEFPIMPARMGKGWDFIPFVPINAVNNEYDIGQIPLLPVAQKAIDYYRKSATYNRTLYLKGDPPMLRTGFSTSEAESASTIGGGVVWDANNPDAKASYIEPTGDVIKDQRQAMMDDLDQARQAVGRLIDEKKQGIESGEALRQRSAAQSVTLVGVLQSVAEGFERALKNITVVMGGNPEEVVFQPNLDFMSGELTADDVVKFTTAKNQGAPLSLQSIHDVFRKGGVTELAFDEEMQLIEDEDPTGTLPSGDRPADADPTAGDPTAGDPTVPVEGNEDA